MKTMTVRDIRLKWPEAEKALARVGELVVTRDAKPVARILPYEVRPRTRHKQFDPIEHQRWLERFWRNRGSRTVDRRAAATRPAELKIALEPPPARF